MKLGDLPLKHLQSGIRMLNFDKTKQGTLFYSSRHGWNVVWIDGKASVFGEINAEEADFYNLEIVTKDGKIVLDKGWFGDANTFTH